MRKLSMSQKVFLLRAVRYGYNYQPHTSNRRSVVTLAAWHRTAKSLEKRGLGKVERHGANTYRFCATEAGVGYVNAIETDTNAGLSA